MPNQNSSNPQAADPIWGFLFYACAGCSRWLTSPACPASGPVGWPGKADRGGSAGKAQEWFEECFEGRRMPVVAHPAPQPNPSPHPHHHPHVQHRGLAAETGSSVWLWEGGDSTRLFQAKRWVLTSLNEGISRLSHTTWQAWFSISFNAWIINTILCLSMTTRFFQTINICCGISALPI